MTTPTDDDHDREDQAREHAWNWFALHADQRMKSVNFYLILLGFLSAGIVTAIKEKYFSVAAGISVFALFATYLFYQLDWRNRALVKIAENALAKFETQLATSTQIDEMRLLERSNENKERAWTYSRIFRGLYGFAALILTLGLLLSVWYVFSSPTNELALKIVVHLVTSLFLCAFGYELVNAAQLRSAAPNKVFENVQFFGGVVSIGAGLISAAVLVFIRLWQ